MEGFFLVEVFTRQSALFFHDLPAAHAQPG
jgi:hypothetical protein